ncbi:MAG: 16S rRNA (adenine(1518)-N(6)/adenine(1519)-N(6))-dimethyltransferase RsmA [Gemmatimonadota bacterium]|nr:16S rRNA (adenine(1518)-N(6)/adenine(1519)-N(6))-dimethyltransferase RsmA [Gemmatimonadota bacterium]
MTALPRAKKRFGQHFLTDPRILSRIADGLAITPTDTVIEIGPGRGALTEALLSRARRVIAIEVDRDLVPILRSRWADDPRLMVVEGDVLEQDLGALANGPFLLAGNVPYNITTPILFHALTRPRPARAVYLVQLEVALRAAAAPNDEAFGALSVNLQAVAQVELLFRVPAGAFTPPPKVESAVIRVTPRLDPVIEADEEEPYRLMVQGAFGLRRKQLKRVVRTLWSLDAEQAGGVVDRAGLDPEARPETLSPSDFAALLRAARTVAGVGAVPAR